MFFCKEDLNLNDLVSVDRLKLDPLSAFLEDPFGSTFLKGFAESGLEHPEKTILKENLKFTLIGNILEIRKIAMLIQQ